MGKSRSEWLSVLVAVGLMACGGDDEGAGAGQIEDPSKLTDGALANVGNADTGVGTGTTPNRVDGGTGTGNTNPNACVTVSNGVELSPVHLAFAFDVSGSMGANDKPWHSRAKKWEPVVAATRDFFAAETSSGLSASLTFFPSDGGSSKLCSASEYTMPDVAMTALPSAQFGEAITAVTPAKDADWRSGTPTLAVLQGSGTFVDSYRKDHAGRYAVVLVTDGYPQSCGTADAIKGVAAEAKRGLAADRPTYVIGVANPKVKDAPDNVTLLHEIAAAGGTEKALIIDTDDPVATSTAFSAAIEKIRKAAISCAVAIPEQRAGATFDKRTVAVHYESGGKSTELAYDKSCAGAGWHYDNAEDPKEIELCPATCDTVRADPDAKLGVDFACEPILVI